MALGLTFISVAVGITFLEFCQSVLEQFTILFGAHWVSVFLSAVKLTVGHVIRLQTELVELLSLL